MANKTSIHAEASLHRKLVLFAVQLEGYLAHFPNCHKYTLTLSHYSLHPVKRGANFCGFRTWATARFVRPHVIKAMRTDARRNRISGVVSRLGHARRTCSFQPLMTYLKDRHHDLYHRLPKSFHATHRNSNPTAGRH